MQDAPNNPWTPPLALACVMIAVWIGLPCLCFGIFGMIGLLEDTDGAGVLAVGLLATAPAVVWGLCAIRNWVSR